MSIGHAIIDEIIKQGMLRVNYPDPDTSHVFTWSANASEQLEALVMRHSGAKPPINFHAGVTPQSVAETGKIIKQYMPADTVHFLIIADKTGKTIGFVHDVNKKHVAALLLDTAKVFPSPRLTRRKKIAEAIRLLRSCFLNW